MCRWLNIPRSSYYCKTVVPVSNSEMEEKIKHIFFESKSRYGARKIKKCLQVEGRVMMKSRMKKEGV